MFLIALELTSLCESRKTADQTAGGHPREAAVSALILSFSSHNNVWPASKTLLYALDVFSYLRQQSAIKKIMDLSLQTKSTFTNSSKDEGPISIYACIHETGFCMRVNTMSSFVEANRLVRNS